MWGRESWSSCNGGDSCYEGHGFKSRRHILDGHDIFTLICFKELYCLFEKTKNKWKRGRVGPFLKKLFYSFFLFSVFWSRWDHPYWHSPSSSWRSFSSLTCSSIITVSCTVSIKNNFFVYIYSTVFLWHSWQRGPFQYQSTRVWNQPSATFLKK